MLIEKSRETKFPVVFLKFLKLLETFYKKFVSGVLRGKALGTVKDL